MAPTGQFERALQVCREFLSPTWTEATSEDVKVERLTLGCSNSLYICKFSDHVETSAGEPRKVLVRFYGSEVTGEGNRYKLVGEAAEAMIFTTLARDNLGPQVYGIFPGGRIEEFLESRWLTVDEFKERKVLKCLAQKIALIHAMNMPIKRINNMRDILIETHQTKLARNIDRSSVSNKLLHYFEQVVKFDTTPEVDLVARLLKEVKSRTLFCHMDLIYQNILLLKKPPNPSNGGSRIMIIDFENAMYNFRGIELGKYFSERLLDVRGEENLLFHPPDEEERHYFVVEYLEEWRKIAPDFDEEVDNVENLTLEIDIGLLANQVHVFNWNWNHPEVGNDKFNFMKNSYTRMKLYQELKKCFVQKHASSLRANGIEIE